MQAMKSAITLEAQQVSLEGRINTQSPTHAVVITHPHPLYGGDMNNMVVSIIAQAYQAKGWTTLRFNFRGTGNSTGQFEKGIGEQKDIQAAVDHLKATGFQTIELAGYSFGAWVLAGWSYQRKRHRYRLGMVSPPVAFVEFDMQSIIPGLAYVITGQLDDIAPPTAIQNAMPKWNPKANCHIIEGADHFFGGFTEPLQQYLNSVIPSTNEWGSREKS